MRSSQVALSFLTPLTPSAPSHHCTACTPRAGRLAVGATRAATARCNGPCHLRDASVSANETQSVTLIPQCKARLEVGSGRLVGCCSANTACGVPRMLGAAAALPAWQRFGFTSQRKGARWRGGGGEARREKAAQVRGVKVGRGAGGGRTGGGGGGGGGRGAGRGGGVV